MSRGRNYDKEFTQNDRLKKENSELKRELGKLRKVVSRLNLDIEQFRNLKELVVKQTNESKDHVKSKRDWTCFECARGIMCIHIIQRRDGTFYFRRCSNEECGHRTKMQRYNDKVEKS